MPIKIKNISGPLFDDTQENLAKAFNDSLLDIAVLGSGWVKDQLYRGHGVKTGYLKSSVHGGLVKNFHAQIDAGEQTKGVNVHYASKVEARYTMFKNTFHSLNQKPKEVDDIIEYHIKENLR